MKSFLLSIISALAFSSVLYAVPINENIPNANLAKTDANIIGHVQDAKTNEHLPFINIIVKGTMIGTTTDATGHYMLKDLPVGDIVLEFSFVGYKKWEKKVTTKPNTLIEVNALLEEEAF